MSQQVPIQPVAWNAVAGQRGRGVLKPLPTQQQQHQSQRQQEREVIVISSDSDEEGGDRGAAPRGPTARHNSSSGGAQQPLVSESVIGHHHHQQQRLPSTHQVGSMVHIDSTLQQPIAAAPAVRRSAQLRRQEQQQRLQQQGSPHMNTSAGSLGSGGGTSVGSPTHSSGGVGTGGVSSSFAASFHPPMPLQEFISTLLTAQTRGNFTERFVQAHLSHLAPEVYERVSSCYIHRRTLDEFLAQVQLIPVQAISTRSLGLDMSLAEFQALVMDDIVVRSSNPDELIESEMSNLGPETRQLVEEAWVTRLSTQSFCRELSILTRDCNRERPGEQFTMSHLAIITQSLLTAESKLRTYVPLTAVQRVVTMKMRTILVDWLVDVSERFKCGTETCHLAVALVDRYLSLHPVLKSELQLLGVSALFLAAKYEMVYPPEMRDYIYISACTYTKDDIVRMERQLFVSLEYNVTIPTVSTLTQCILQQQDPAPSPKQTAIASFLVDILMTALPYNSSTPHVIAATCVYLSKIAAAGGVASSHFLPNIRSRVPSEIRHFLPTAWTALVESGLIPPTTTETSASASVAAAAPSSSSSSGGGLKYAAVKSKFSGPASHFVSGDAYPCEQWVVLIRAVQVDIEGEQRDLERLQSIQQEQQRLTEVQPTIANDLGIHPPTPL